MLQDFPASYEVPLTWEWAQWEPHFQTLVEADLTDESLPAWLSAWTQVSTMLWEVRTRLRIAADINTEDEAAEARNQHFNVTIAAPVQQYTFELSKKLVDSGLVTDGIRVPLRNLEAAIAIFHPDNVPLITKENDLRSVYSRLRGAQTVMWEGEERTISQMRPLQYDTDRSVREQAWRLARTRILEDREAFDDLWAQYMDLRKQMIANLGMDNYRDFAWKARNRHDYTPDDVKQFCASVEKVVVPVLAKIREQRRQQLGVEKLRPWDLQVDPQGRPPLQPYKTIAEWIDTTAHIFNQIDPELGTYFEIMRDDNLLDLENRKGKRPGGYNTSLPVTQKPFILMNAVRLGADVRTLLHEAGHAFHAFERFNLPYAMQRRSPMEFNEVASMAMELLALPYLTEDRGGYFTADEAARYTLEQLTGILSGWCHMATVVLFQHWIYENHDLASDAAECDKKWIELRERFIPGVDWTGIEAYRVTRWRTQLHIFLYPFYYIEYAFARLGSVQVWKNALENPDAALKAYRDALALGGTVTLPELFETAGARLAFDEATMQDAVDLIEAKLADFMTMDV